MGKKIIVAGHICLDITPVFPKNNEVSSLDEIMVPGRLINVGAAEVHTGGSVANTGLALKKLGNDVALMGKVGNDAFGGMVRRLLSDSGVDGLLTDDDSSTSYSVVLAVPGIDRIFLHDPGANNTFSSSDIPDEALEDAVLLHFGYPPLMKKIYADNGAELEAIFSRAKAKGIATSLDFAAIDSNSEAGQVDWLALLQNVLPQTDFFLPSFEELCFMLDREKFDRLHALGGDMTEKLDFAQDVMPLAEKCLALGCGFVLIKCGTAGMYFASGNMENVGARLELDAKLWAHKSGIQPCYKAEKICSATGCGDASIAAFLTALLTGKAPVECAMLAAAEGACAVTSYDALSGLKTVPELEAKLAAGWDTMGGTTCL